MQSRLRKAASGASAQLSTQADAAAGTSGPLARLGSAQRPSSERRQGRSSGAAAFYARAAKRKLGCDMDESDREPSSKRQDGERRLVVYENGTEAQRVEQRGQLVEQRGARAGRSLPVINITFASRQREAGGLAEQLEAAVARAVAAAMEPYVRARRPDVGVSLGFLRISRNSFGNLQALPFSVSRNFRGNLQVVPTRARVQAEISSMCRRVGPPETLTHPFPACDRKFLHDEAPQLANFFQDQRF